MFGLGVLLSHGLAPAEPLPVLRWGADIESGAPFSYRSPDESQEVIGYEAEIMQALAQELGMRPEFVQNNWEGLIQGLDRGDYDLAINGIEITPDRQEVVRFSRPYYYTAEVLTVNKANTDIGSLTDTRDRRVGTLNASLAERILRDLPYPVHVITYSEEVHLYGDLALGRLDAVLMDEAIALYYAQPNPALKLVGERVGKMTYGLVTRLKDKEFGDKVDRALGALIEKGVIRRILERWNLWNSDTAVRWNMSSAMETEPVAYKKYLETAWVQKSGGERLKKYVSFLPVLGKGALMTLQISILAMMLAMMVGLILALMRLYGHPILAGGAIAFVEVFRGTPLLIQLLLIFYGLPHLGLRLDPFLAAVLGLGLNYGACEAENYRAGILSISRSQSDAAHALGMTWWQSLRHVVLPQALRVVIPPMTNDFIALLKDSSLVSVISMVELTTAYGQLASTHFDYLGIGLLTAAIYFLIGLPFVRLSRYFERRLNHTLRVGGQR